MARQAYRGELEHLRSMHVKAVDERDQMKRRLDTVTVERDSAIERLGEQPKKVEAIQRDVIGGEHLVEVGSDPNLEYYYVVCFWKDDTVSSGFSKGFTNSDMAHAIAKIHQDANRQFDF